MDMSLVINRNKWENQYIKKKFRRTENFLHRHRRLRRRARSSNSAHIYWLLGSTQRPHVTRARRTKRILNMLHQKRICHDIINVERSNPCEMYNNPYSMNNDEIIPQKQQYIDINHMIKSAETKYKNKKKKKRRYKRKYNTKNFEQYWKDMQKDQKQLQKITKKYSSTQSKISHFQNTLQRSEKTQRIVIKPTNDYYIWNTKIYNDWNISHIQFEAFIAKLNCVQYTDIMKQALCMIKLYNSQNVFNQIKITNGTFLGGNVKLLNEQGDIEEIYPIICSENKSISLMSSPYEFGFIHPSIETIQKSIFRLAKNCLKTLSSKNILRIYNCRKGCEFRFNECHNPHYNLLPLSFDICVVLYRFIPSIDIISNILIPYVYNWHQFKCNEENNTYRVVIDIPWEYKIKRECEDEIVIENQEDESWEPDSSFISSADHSCPICGAWTGLFGCYCSSSSDSD
eukprot:205237_1